MALMSVALPNGCSLTLKMGVTAELSGVDRANTVRRMRSADQSTRRVCSALPCKARLRRRLFLLGRHCRSVVGGS